MGCCVCVCSACVCERACVYIYDTHICLYIVSVRQAHYSRWENTDTYTHSPSHTVTMSVEVLTSRLLQIHWSNVLMFWQILRNRINVVSLVSLLVRTIQKNWQILGASFAKNINKNEEHSSGHLKTARFNGFPFAMHWIEFFFRKDQIGCNNGIGGKTL